MNESSSRPRRSLLVVLLDATLSLATAVQAGNLPGSRGGGERPAARPRRAGVVWLAIGVLAAAVGTGVLVSALLRSPDKLADLPPDGAVGPAPTSDAPPRGTTAPAVPGTTSTSTSAATATSSPARKVVTSSVPASRVPTAGGARLTAGYSAAGGTGLLGYHATVTLTGQGPGAATDWRLTLTLPRPTLRIADVGGATVRQEGSVWTFTPTAATRRVAAGTSVVLAFDVFGATLVDATPTDCRIDDEPCTGLPG